MKRTENKRFFDVKGEIYVLIVDNRLGMYYLREVNMQDSDERSCVTGRQWYNDDIPHIPLEDYLDADGNLIDDFKFMGSLDKIIQEEEMHMAVRTVKKLLYMKHETNEINIYDDWGALWEELQKRGEIEKGSEYTLDDIILPEETKDKLRRVIKLMGNNERYARIGAKIDKGILLFGVPGGGKSRAVECMAGEIHAHFIHSCGSDFCLKYVGVGSENVRKLFDEARSHKRAIIFIDELDAVGRERGLGENTERDTTLNQLLVEISKIKPDENIFIVGATNNKDLLDSALIRSGRLSTHIEILPPDKECRKDIFNLYINKLVHEEGIDVDLLAEMTEGCVGADIEYICNNAGLYAVDCDRDVVTLDDLMHEIEDFLNNRELKQQEEKKKKIGFGI